jgi:hypothetical protein
MKLRCAVLDDFQGVATTLADWMAFGMEVVAWSQNLTEERAQEVGCRYFVTKTKCA